MSPVRCALGGAGVIEMRGFRWIVAAALAATACGGGHTGPRGPVDVAMLAFVNGGTATYSEDEPGVSIVAHAADSTTGVEISQGGTRIRMGFPTVAQGTVTGTCGMTRDGRDCTAGSATYDVTTTGTGHGAQVVGTVRNCSMVCGTSSVHTIFSGSFSATYE
jgi:hypothetical protein